MTWPATIPHDRLKQADLVVCLAMVCGREGNKRCLARRGRHWQIFADLPQCVLEWGVVCLVSQTHLTGITHIGCVYRS
jgi:hypothetical protein